MISAAFPYQKQRRRALGSEMAYVEVGEGDPIVLLHGNPTSSYLWRNVLPHLQPLGRCIAPDLIGMGDSDKLPDSGPGSYRFVEHRRYLDALLEALEVRERVTFVIHDWGSALGFDWANRHREAVKGIAYMEAIVGPQYWDHWDKFGMRPALRGLRSEAGEAMVLRDNFFIEKILPGAILRAPLRRGDGGVPTAVRRARRGATADADVAPADPHRGRARGRGCDRERRGLAGDEQCTQAVLEGRARWDPRPRRGSRLGPQLPSADRGDGRGGPFRPGRFAGRDRAGRRRLDGDVGLTGAMQGHEGVASVQIGSAISA
jgi:pimeloyl-ACP methyl ester carboxylesterase